MRFRGSLRAWSLCGVAVCLGAGLTLGACRQTPARAAEASAVQRPLLDSNILGVVARLKAAGFPQGQGISARYSTALLEVDEQGRLHLLLTFEAPLAATQAVQLQALGWDGASATGSTRAEGWLPAAQVQALGTLPFIRWTAPAWPARRR